MTERFTIGIPIPLGVNITLSEMSESDLFRYMTCEVPDHHRALMAAEALEAVAAKMRSVATSAKVLR